MQAPIGFFGLVYSVVLFILRYMVLLQFFLLNVGSFFLVCRRSLCDTNLRAGGL
jgi:hypothetical protein